MNKAQLNYPELVAKKSAEWYPCIIESAKSDSSAYQEWQKQINAIDTLFDTIVKLDTIRLVKNCQTAIIKYKYLFKNMPSIHDTIRIKSTAKEFELQSQLDAKIKELEKTKSHYIGSIWTIVIALILLIISMIIQFFK